jgi:hypothetical protein
MGEEGTNPVKGMTLFVDYTLWLENGEEIESTD